MYRRLYMQLYKRLLSLAITLGFFISIGLLAFFGIAVVQANQTVPLKPNLLLLNSYTDQSVAGWVMSEKLDGVRAYWDGKQLISRNGQVFAVPKFFTEGFPPFELDGELWLGREAFAETVSIVNRQQPHDGWKKLTYQIFEVPNQLGGLVSRLGVLEEYLLKNPNRYLKVIAQSKVDSKGQAQAELTRVIELGGEGLVLRDPTKPYQVGRSASALKLKMKEDAECRVTGYTKGRGKYRGQVGALVCEIVEGPFTHLRGATARTIKVGSGLSDADRQQPPVIGRLITFQYIGLTKNGLPRFPVYLRVRADAGL